jgi:hypothetical protein
VTGCEKAAASMSYALEDLKLPESVMNLIKKGVNGEIEENPKAGDPIF